MTNTRDKGREESEEDSNAPMENITINLPKAYDDCIQLLKQLGIVPSRAEAIRRAIDTLLNCEIETNIPLLLFGLKSLRKGISEDFGHRYPEPNSRLSKLQSIFKEMDIKKKSNQIKEKRKNE